MEQRPTKPREAGYRTPLSNMGALERTFLYKTYTCSILQKVAYIMAVSNISINNYIKEIISISMAQV